MISWIWLAGEHSIGVVAAGSDSVHKAAISALGWRKRMAY